MPIDKQLWKNKTEQIMANRLAGAEASGDTSLKEIEAVVTLSKNGEQTVLLTAETPISLEATEALSITETQQRLMDLAQSIVNDLKADSSDSFDVSVRFTETKQNEPGTPKHQVSYDGSALNDELKASPVVYYLHKDQIYLDLQPLNVCDIVVFFEEKDDSLTVKEIEVVQGVAIALAVAQQLEAKVSLDEKYRMIEVYRFVVSGLVVLSWVNQPRHPSNSPMGRLVWKKRFVINVI